MKTIITTLPIYDRLSKQCFERGKHAGGDTPTPIICPRHRLPSFQWLDESDGAASVSRIEMLGLNNLSSIDIFNHWHQSGLTTFVSSGLEITTAVNGSGSAVIDAYMNTKYEHLEQAGAITTVTLNYHKISGAGGAHLYIRQEDIDVADVVLAEGVNTLSYISTGGGISVDITVGVGSFTFTGVSITSDITNYFAALPTLAHDYFVYNGDTLNYLLPVGEFYLKITMNNGFIYYSEWFKVDCVYENLITGFTVQSYNPFTHSDTVITSAINSSGSTAYAWTNLFSVRKGEVITVISFLTLNSGQLPSIVIEEIGVVPLSNVVTFTAGLNIIILTITGNSDNATIRISNSINANWSTSEILVIREYSTKYLTINFHNDCDLGDVYYHGGFTQSVYLPSEPMEPSFPVEEEGVKNGEGQFIRTFARQVKKYLLRTKEMPDYMVDVFNRMKLCDSIQLVDLVGDVHDVYNLEVDHEWLGTDKYYAKLDLTFDYNEVVVISGCCNNIS